MSDGHAPAPTAPGMPGRVAIQGGHGDPHGHGAAHHPKLQHHFDDMGQQAEASTLGMWVFLVTEIMFFGGLFMAYLLYRWANPTAFEEASAHLSIWLGGFNTAVLIFSSLTMALAVRAAQTSAPPRTQVFWIAATMVLGTVFLGVKVIEYGDKFAEGIVPGPGFNAAIWENPQGVEIFYALYFCMTGLHALHMVIGLGIMAVIGVMAWRRAFDADYYTPVEVSGLYWHFVDIVWIFLFPLLYLIGRHYTGH